jgi:dynein heavy chain
MFNKAIDMSELSKVLSERLVHLINTITRVIYNNVCRGLFEEHKLIFSFLITI